MKITETNIKGCFIIEPTLFSDERGYFFESFNEMKFTKAIGYEVDFVQDNQSFSKYGVLRGLHLQKGKDAQAKLVRVLSREVLDVAVDLREKSATYGQHVSIELSAENKKQLFIPRGFAHGFIVLSDHAEFYYKVDNYYAPNAEGGLLFNDKVIGIDWKIEESNMTVNKKDYELPLLKDYSVK